MRMQLDGSTVIRRVLDNPDVFPATTEIDEIARKLVVACMKKATSLSDVKSICAALGDGLFKDIADGISDAEAKSVVSKVDKENKEAKSAGGPAQRVLLVELATGRVEPRAKIIKERASKKTSSPTSEAGKALKGKAPGARRKATASSR